jgi:hypothetical protein
LLSAQTASRGSAAAALRLITCRSILVTHSILGMSAYRALPASPSAIPLLRPTAVAVLVGTAVVLAGEALSAPLPATAAAWGGMALAAWCGALLTACSSLSARHGMGLAQWKLGSWFLLWCALADGLASITWADPQSGLTAQILPSSVVRAEWLTAAAVTAWAAAYCFGPRRTAAAAGIRFMRSVTDRRTGIVRSPMTPWLLYAVGTAARLVGAILTGHFGYTGSAIATVSSAAWYQQALSLVAFACPLAITVAGLRVFRERAPGAKTTLAVLLAAEITTAAVMGIKGQFVTAVMAVAIARASAGRGLPRGLLLAAIAFFLLIVIPFTVAYRAEVRGGPADLTPRAAVAAAPAVAGSAASTASAGTIPESVSYLAQRLQEIDAVAIVLQKTPSQVPDASPAEIPETLAADLIPRALWPGKPILDPGYQFSQEYYGTPSGVVTAAAITPQADLYRYGGWVTMLAGMFALGWLVRVLDDVLDVRVSPHAALLVLLLWPVLATPEGTFTGTLLGLPGLLFTWLAITVVTFRRTA